jgi:adenylate cyclase
MMNDNLDNIQGGALVDEIADWLMDQALAKIELESLSEQFFQRLYAAGIPISRAHIAFDTLHPLFAAVSMEWNRGQEIVTNYHSHAVSKNTDDWYASPFFALIENGLMYLRRRLSGEDALIDFSVLKEFQDAGGTDYLAYMVAFGETKADGGMVGSWLTERPGGFSDRDIRALLRLQKRLGVAYKIGVREQISENIVTAYLGNSAGQKVMSGSIQRGDGDDIHAVIWFCDLRSSVKLANALPRAEFLILLNNFLECMAGAVLDNGGEVLRFVGDAALAIFPIDVAGCDVCSAPQACENAIAAAADAASRIETLNQQRQKSGEPALEYGLGLHVGDVMYGNIGSPERIEFTVVGAAANMAARIESQCKVLAKPLLISSKFADVFPGQLQSVGHHQLDGIEVEQELFTR